MAAYIGVSYTALVIRLRDMGLFEYHNILDTFPMNSFFFLYVEMISPIEYIHHFSFILLISNVSFHSIVYSNGSNYLS